MRKESVNIGPEYGEEYFCKYVFQELTWAIRSRIIQKHTKSHPLSGQVQNSDFIAIQAETIWASLKEQPIGNPLSLEKLLGEENGVPISLGELLSKIVNNLCALSGEETAFLFEPSDAKNQTLQSPTSGSARNSVGPQTSLPGNQPKQSNNS